MPGFCKAGAIVARRWVAAAGIISLMTACGGLPTSLPIPRSTAGTGGSQQSADEQQLMLATMQRLFNLLNTTQRDGQTVLTTRITKSVTTDGRRIGPRDYALGKVSPAQATLDFTWHFTDPPTSTDASGTIRLDHIGVLRGQYSGGRLETVELQFGYAVSAKVEAGDQNVGDWQNTPQQTVQVYMRSDTNGGVDPSGHASTGAIHMPVVPLGRAIRSKMTVPEDLAVTEGSGAVVRIGSVSPNDVRCKLFRSGQSRAPENVAVDSPTAPVKWTADDSPDTNAYRGAGTYVNQHVEMGYGTIPATVIVNADERSGTITGSQPAPISGEEAVSGKFVCLPPSVETTLPSYS